MMGIKDISVINTPPVDRQSIRSFVITFDEQVIKEAIQKEVQRGGQVYFVHNRVRSIGAMARYLRQLLPNLRIGVGHGQMEEGMLEKVMVDFINQRYQVLVCTAIIESGLDIPSVNTIIVNRADQFGLAQLYQLRGRVGRSHQRAYAYLLIPGKTTISTDARKRLAVLQDFSDLGAGFKIAYHDLEIRGAGNFLGEAQSGHIAAIGFELYTQLLSDTVATLKGKEGKSKRDPEINIPVAASIPGEYIDDIQDRLRIYSRFTTADSIEKLDEMMEELLDCYGSVPQEIDNLKEMMKIKFLLQNLQVRHFDIKGNKIGIIFEEKTDINVSGLVKFVQAEPGLRRLNPDMKLIITCPQKDVLQHEDELFPWAQNTLKQLGSCVKSSDFPDGNY